MPQGNRGMALEMLVNHANASYRAKGIAIVDKLPTPIKVTKSNGTRVLSGYFEAKSSVDYFGIYQGHSLVFEAKSTKIDSRFDLNLIHAHQVEHLRVCDSMGAISFVILEFARRNEIFYLPAQLVVRAWDASLRGATKSIPYDDISAVCYRVTAGRGIVLDYLAVVDELIRQTA